MFLVYGSRNDLLCVEWDVKRYTLTHSVTLAVIISGFDDIFPLLAISVIVIVNANNTADVLSNALYG